ncbi:Signal transduction protein [Gammaproteobacteria bacterium]
MKVEDVMTRWVKTVSPDARLNEVAASMCLHRIPSLPVVEDTDRLVGIIAESDILRHLFPTLDIVISDGLDKMDFEAMEDDYHNLNKLKVSDLMNRKVFVVRPDMPVLKATSVMVHHKLRRIPVAEDRRLKGILSLGDVHKALLRKSI